ncbi:hypothetical protein BJX61DRAFT_541755 [Aspergillus egyptiacus]|nr:hypothetical protein BJX61DRAFT_541755 [Aspergillus egyptiacus]
MTTKLSPAASSNQVPTISTLHNPHIKRSVSYNPTSPVDDSNSEDNDNNTNTPNSPPHGAQSPTGNKIDQAGCDQMLKASLTGILNSGQVMSDARGRKVQDLLLQTERDYRRERRKSLGEQRAKAMAMAKLEGLRGGSRSVE